MIPSALLIGAAAFVGHWMFWTGVFNRVHATGLHHKTIKAFEKVVYLLLLAVPAAIALPVARGDLTLDSPATLLVDHPAVAFYLTLCLGTLAFGLPVWIAQKTARTPPELLSETATSELVREEDGRPPIGDRVGRWFARIPGNEILQLHRHEKELEIARLPATLDGFSIAHLSDLHYTGHLARSFFDRVVDRANEWAPDLTVVTGDLVDKSPCIDWIRPTLGRLRAKYGVFYVLGNHDKRLTDLKRLKDELADAGLIHLGGKTRMLAVGGETILLAGNELPWFGPAPELGPTNADDAARSPLRLLLSHSPDQLPWAVRHEFDLVMAGHTHGGQIRLPGVGPILSPSRFGVKYASGVFAQDGVVMHVSRGLSGLDPIRWRCPPELARLVLRPSAARPHNR